MGGVCVRVPMLGVHVFLRWADVYVYLYMHAGLSCGCVGESV